MTDTSGIIGRALVLTAGLAAASCADAPLGDPLTLDPVFDAEAVAYVGGRPLVLSPDGRRVAFSIIPADRSAGEPTTATGARELAAVRILDVVTERVRAAAVGATARRLVDEGHDPVPTLRCWDPDGRVLYMRTTARSWLALDVGRPDLAWRAASEDGPPSGCPAREVPRTPHRAGDFQVTTTRGGGLRLEHLPRGRVVFESDAPLIREHRLRHVSLAPGGGRLVLSYSSALGSFSGAERSVLVAVDPSGGSHVHELRPPVLFSTWHPAGNQILAYGRLPGRRAYGIFRLSMRGARRR